LSAVLWQPGPLPSLAPARRATDNKKRSAFPSSCNARRAGRNPANPHVYLDTVLLIGSLGAQQPMPGAYVIGAASASLLWFFTLALGAAWLAPWLARPLTWRLIDLAVAIMMYTIAVQLLLNT